MQNLAGVELIDFAQLFGQSELIDGTYLVEHDLA